MVGPYRGEDTGGLFVCGVGITVGGYTNGWDRGRGPQIFPEYAPLGTTVSGVERPDCSAVVISSAQEGILVGWGGCCDVATTACAVEKSGVAVVPEYFLVAATLVMS